MNLAVIVITYFPSKEMREHLKQLSKIAEQVYVIDNTENESSFLFKDLTQHNIQVTQNHQNLGIAKAINLGVEQAKKAGYEYVCFFDQDTKIPPDYFIKMADFYRQYATPQTALIAPNFYDINTQSEAYFTQIQGGRRQRKPCKGRRLLNVNIAITSGSLLSIQNFERLGRMREAYFIDYVDTEFCLRAYQHKQEVLVNCQITLEHAIGDRKTHRFLGISITPAHYSPIRRYYIARNGTRMSLEYGKNMPVTFWIHGVRIMHESLGVLLYETQKTAKLKAIAMGIYDGIKGKMGKCQRKF